MNSPGPAENRSDQPWYGSRTPVMRGFILGTIGYVLVVGVVLATMWVMVEKVRTATADYEAAKAKLQAAQSELKDTLAKSAALNGQLTQLQGQYQSVVKLKADADKAAADSQARVAELQKRLDQIYDFVPHIVPISEIDEKMAYGALGERGFRIFQMAIADAHQKVPFGGANTPAGGFTSPGYAEYLLSKIGIARPAGALKPREGAPQNGDIITYQPAYYMFYFRIPDAHKEFVIGMTPEGVLALEPNFGTRMGVFAVLQP